MPPDPEDDEDEDEYARFKKKDDSGRYECEKSESPEWRKSQNFKKEYKTNGLKGNKLEYYRWDHRHKDIEIYNWEARYIGSKDPVSGKIYRPGDMVVSEKLKGLL